MLMLTNYCCEWGVEVFTPLSPCWSSLSWIQWLGDSWEEWCLLLSAGVQGDALLSVILALRYTEAGQWLTISCVLGTEAGDGEKPEVWPEPDNKGDTWPFLLLGERAAARSTSYSKERLIAFFLFFWIKISLLTWLWWESCLRNVLP